MNWSWRYWKGEDFWSFFFKSCPKLSLPSTVSTEIRNMFGLWNVRKLWKNSERCQPQVPRAKGHVAKVLVLSRLQWKTQRYSIHDNIKTTTTTKKAENSLYVVQLYDYSLLTSALTKHKTQSQFWGGTRWQSYRASTHSLCNTLTKTHKSTVNLLSQSTAVNVPLSKQQQTT